MVYRVSATPDLPCAVTRYLSWFGWVSALAVFACSLGNRQIPSTPTPATDRPTILLVQPLRGNDHVHSESADPRRGVADLAGDGRDRPSACWPLPEPKVLFGDDVGFRVEGMRGEVPTGVIVIKVNGNWVEVQVGGPKPGPIR